MPTAVREQVLAAIHAALAAIAGVVVERNRSDEVQADELATPVLVMVDGGQQADHDTHGLTAYAMTVDVEGYVAAASDAAVGPAVSDIYAKVAQALAADPTLGGIAVDLVEGDTAVTIDRHGARPVGAFNTTYTVTYFTAPGDPYAPAP